MEQEKTKKELTRIEALRKFGMTRLPKMAAEGDLWAWAVVLVLKTDGKEYYCVQGTDDKGNLVIKNDYEEKAGIVRILKVYPITRSKIELNKKPLEKCTKEDKTKWLAAAGKEWKDGVKISHVPDAETLGKMSDEELDALCVRVLRIREDQFMRTNGVEETGEEGSHEEE